MAHTIEELKAHLGKATALTKALTGSKKELAELPNLLDPTEAVQSITPARRSVTAGASVASAGALMGSGLLVATDKRLLFINKKMFSTDTADYSISKINSVSFEKKLLLSNILITFSGEKLAFSVEDKEAGQHFVDTVRDLIQSSTSADKAGGDDVVAKLEKLAGLRDKGILSDEEFQNEKTKVLNQ